MENYKMTIIKELFNNSETDTKVEGLTLILEGKIQEVFDTIVNTSEDYNSNEEVLRDALFMGLSHILYNLHSDKTKE